MLAFAGYCLAAPRFALRTVAPGLHPPEYGPMQTRRAHQSACGVKLSKPALSLPGYAHLQRNPTVNGDRLPCNIAAAIADEKCRERADVVRSLLASERHALLDLVEEDVARLEARVFRHTHLHERRQHLPGARPQESRADRVDANVLRPEFQRQRLRQR